MKKVKVLLCFSMMSIYMLASCNTPAEKAEANKVEVSSHSSTESLENDIGETREGLPGIPDFPDRYEENVNDTLSFKATVDIPEGIEKNLKYEIKGTVQTFDYDLVEKLLFTDINVIQSETENVAGEGGKIIDHIKMLSGENGEYLYMSNGHIIFKEPKWDDISNSFALSNKETVYNAPLYSTGEEFGFSSAEAAFENINQVLTDMGFSSELRYKYFSLDYKTLNKERQEFDYKTGQEIEPDGEGWMEADNTYYFSIDQLAGALPVYRIWNYGTGQEGEPDLAPVQIAYDKDGILYLELYQLYDFNYEEKQWKLAPLEDIINTIKKRYDLAVTGDRVEFTSLRLAYIANFADSGTVVLTPAWLCNNVTTTIDGYSYYHQVIVNAKTAEEMVFKF